ncbi:MAG: T9SS type A sorting domain-containing protein, partial [Saprospiraceae bacterium]|nr:T9SS type A sorting domain-containing protein [Saprospiraceae bacterium]
FNRAIHGVAVWHDTVYVAGSFFEVDGEPLRFLARYVGDPANSICSAPISSAPEPKSEGFGLWPNPATDLLQVQAHAPIEALWVHDAQGREVLRPVVSGERVSVSVEQLPAGLYFVSLRAGGKIWGGKFVKG